MANRNRSTDDVTINLTPMIDVVFLLVIFFMVGSKFSESESRIDVSVPSVGPMTAMSRVPDQRVVEVADDGQILLDGQLVTREQLVEQLAIQIAQYPDLQVTVRADSAGTLQGFAETLHHVRRSGVSRIGVAVKSDPATTGGMRR